MTSIKYCILSLMLNGIEWDGRIDSIMYVGAKLGLH